MDKKLKFKLGDTVRIIKDCSRKGEIDEIVYVDDSDSEYPYYLDMSFYDCKWYGDNDLELVPSMGEKM